MRIRLICDSLVLLDVTILEPELGEPADPAPTDIHDLSVDHPIGFSADVDDT